MAAVAWLLPAALSALDGFLLHLSKQPRSGVSLSGGPILSTHALAVAVAVAALDHDAATWGREVAIPFNMHNGAHETYKTYVLWACTTANCAMPQR